MSTHNFIHKALLLVACLMPHVAVWGQIVGSTFGTDYLRYRVLNEQEVEVIGLKDRFGIYEIKIPSTVTAEVWNKTYTVTTIGDSAFYDFDDLININIPNSVTTIGNHAFSSCIRLSNINIPNSVKTIGNGAFKKCKKLASIKISESVTTIRDSVFEGCEGLKNINIPNSVTTIGDAAFSNCRNLTNINIPNSVTMIGNYAFFNCRWLSNINIPNSVTTIGNEAFSNCERLSNINIPNSVTTIGNGAFSNCERLSNINIPNSVTTIGNHAFWGCKRLTDITVDSDNTNYSSSDGVLFDKAQQLLIQCPEGKYGVYQIPNSVTTIGNGAFQNSDLRNINIPNSVTTIKDYAFQNSNLTNINMSNNSITTIGNGAFSGCKGLTNINIPNSVTTIGDYAFSDCHDLKTLHFYSINPPIITNNSFGYTTTLQTIYVPQKAIAIYQAAAPYQRYNIQAINGEVGSTFTVDNLIHKVLNEKEVEVIFYETQPTGALQIPSTVTATDWNKTYSVTTIGNNAFMGCQGLTNINIPNSVTTIGNYAFSDCKGLTNINIPNSVTTIGNYTFSGCKGLTNINIPNSVTTIEDYAFSDCENLTSIHIPNSVTTIWNDTFWGCKRLTDITVDSDNGLYSSSNGVLFDKFQQKLILCPEGKQGEYQIPNSVTSIEDYAFKNSNLTNIHIPNSVEIIEQYVFEGCSGLKSLYIHSIKPPYAYFSFGILFNPQTIYVPQEAVATYKATEPYNQYNIQGMDEATGIGEVETTEVPQSGNIYDLNGRLVRTDGNLQALPKGIYILNGKKVVR